MGQSDPLAGECSVGSKPSDWLGVITRKRAPACLTPNTSAARALRAGIYQRGPLEFYRSVSGPLLRTESRGELVGSRRRRSQICLPRTLARESREVTIPSLSTSRSGIAARSAGRALRDERARHGARPGRQSRYASTSRSAVPAAVPLSMLSGIRRAAGPTVLLRSRSGSVARADSGSSVVDMPNISAGSSSPLGPQLRRRVSGWRVERSLCSAASEPMR